jgi:hypothetical protein
MGDVLGGAEETVNRDTPSYDDTNHRDAPSTETDGGLLRQTVLEHSDDSIGGGQVTDGHPESRSRTSERRVIRRATFICLGVTLLPLIVVAALLAKGQLDNSGVVSQAQTHERQALTELNQARLAEAQAQALVNIDQNKLASTESKGVGPLFRDIENDLANKQQQLARSEALLQNASQNYNVATEATARAEIQLGNPLSRWIIYAGVAGALAVGDTLVILYLHTDRERDQENRAIVQTIAESTAKLEAESTDVTGLWLANEKQLAGYHQLILNYAATSRATTKFSLWFGFVFVSFISVCVLFTHSLATTVASSVIATVGAAVTGYIARTVLRNSETSSSEVIEFFSHPIETQRLLTARQLIDTMPEEAQDQAKLLLIKELMRVRSAEKSRRGVNSIRKR